MPTTFDITEPYSWYECDELAVKVAGESAYVRNDCVGKIDVERETRTVKKKCRGNVKKSMTRPTGNGKLTILAHFKLDLYRKMTGMTNEGLKPGIYAYDNTKAMPEMSIVFRVKNEDGIPVYMGYPRCKIEELNTLSIENGAEEVAEVEITVSYMPDDHNKGEYMGFDSEMTGSLKGDNWMTTFSSSEAALAEA